MDFEHVLTENSLPKIRKKCAAPHNNDRKCKN